MADPALQPDFSEFLRLLNAHRVSYLIVGGYAVGFHGHPRATADIDIWIPMREAGSQPDLAALRADPSEILVIADVRHGPQQILEVCRATCRGERVAEDLPMLGLRRAPLSSPRAPATP